MIGRVLETEAMDTPSEALDYDTMDHGEVNRLFVDDLLALEAAPGLVLDLGTGTAQVPIELCHRASQTRVVAVDLARSMLGVARQNVDRAGLATRVALQQVDAKRLPYRVGRFRVVMSNSIVHHIPEPRDLLAEGWRVLAPGGLIFLRDLCRPPDDQTLRHLVDTYAAGTNAHQRQMFADSLRAALTADETGKLVSRLGVSPSTVQPSSDRHWTWTARKPAPKG